MSQFRLLRVCTSGPYPDLFARFVDGLGPQTFEAAMQSCRENGFLYPGSFKATMESLDVEVLEILIDVPELQRRWLREASEPAATAPHFDPIRTFWSQLSAFRPDVVYFQTFLALPAEVRRQIKSRCRSVRLVVGHRGFPLMDCVGHDDIDAVFLGYPQFHDRWHAVGVKTFFHLHAFDETLLPALANATPKHDFTFVGTTGWGFVPHRGRYFDLRRVLEETCLEVWGNEPPSVAPVAPWTWRNLPSTARAYAREALITVLHHLPYSTLAMLGDRAPNPIHPLRRLSDAATRRKRGEDPPRTPFWSLQPPRYRQWFDQERSVRELFPQRIHSPVFGLEYLRLLASSRVTWNRHLEMDGAGANMRLFEACGAGACQLVDARREVAAAYEPGKEIVVYDDINDCIEKAKYLLEHESERARIAKAGQERTLSEHTSASRVRSVFDELRTLL